MKTDPAFCPHVRTEGFQCVLKPGHTEPRGVHRDRTGETWPLHLPFAEPKVRVDPITDDEAEEIDRFMGDHMYGHQISNNYSGMSCNTQCRTQAIQIAVNKVLAAR